MRRVVVLVMIAVASLAAAPLSDSPFGRLPLHFEPDGRGGFFSAGVNFEFRFAPGRIEYHTAHGRFSMVLPGSYRDVLPSGYSKLPGRSNYFAGSGPESWRTNVPHYAGVRYREVQPGVDLLFYGNGTELEFDLHLKPGARPERIRIGFDGADSLSVDDTGGLVVRKGSGELRFRRPVSYQPGSAERREVASGFRVTPDGEAAFEIGEYDRALPLVIDPVLAFSAVIGPGNVSSLAVDSKGDIYVGGLAVRPSPSLGPIVAPSAYITKVAGDGSSLIYSTFYGSPGNSGPEGIAVDDRGQVVITGTAFTGSIPIINAMQATRRGQDAYIAKLSADGASFFFSTYYGGAGTEFGSGLVLDGDGSVIVAGRTTSSDLPVTNAVQATPRWRNLFRTIDGGSTWERSSNGLDGEGILSVAVDPSEPANVYAAGGDGLFASTNRGASWFKLASFPCGSSNAIAVHPTNGRVLYANCVAGIFLSVNRGSSWRRLLAADVLIDDLRFVFKLVIDPRTPSTMYGAAFGGVIKSVDAGETWFRIDFGLQETGLQPSIQDFVLDPRNPLLLYAAVDRSVLRSANGGLSWTPATPELGQTGRALRLAVNPVTAEIYAAGVTDTGVAVFRSVDNGRNWLMTAPLPPDVLVGGLLALPGAVFVTTSRGLLRSLNRGSSWETVDIPRFQPLQDIVADPTEDNRIFASSFETIRQRAFLLKLSPNGQTAQFGTYLTQATADGLAIDPNGNLYLAGEAGAWEEPISRIPSNACESVERMSVFVTKMASSGTQVLYSFCLDAANSTKTPGVGRVAGIAVDGTGSAYLTGIMDGEDFPLQSPLRSESSGDFDGFLFKLSPTGDSLLFSTFLGGDRYDEPRAIVASGEGRVVIAGLTDSRNFPITSNAIQPSMRGARWHEIIFPPLQSARARFGRNGFVSVIDTNQPRLVYSSYLGGSRFDQALALAVDPGGHIIVAGEATSRDFPKGDTPSGADNGGEGIFLSKIDLAAQPPLPDLRAVTDAASFLSGRISANEIVTLFGNGLGPSPGVSFRLDEFGQIPLTLGGSRVLVDGSPIPLLYVSAGQINAIAPGTLSPGEIVAVEVENGGQRSSPYRVEAAPAAPGIFTLTGAGFGPAAALNQNLTVNSPANPAARGSVIVLYATGPGPSDTPFPDRRLTPLPPPWPAPTGEVAVLIGDRAAKILYAGAAPGLVPGVLQINAEIAMEVEPGPGVPVGLSIGGVWSDPSLSSPKPTIAVE